MKYKVGDHLQEIDTPPSIIGYHGYVTDTGESSLNNKDENWYL